MNIEREEFHSKPIQIGNVKIITRQTEWRQRNSYGGLRYARPTFITVQHGETETPMAIPDLTRLAQAWIWLTAAFAISLVVLTKITKRQ